jgi:hypothetical protein
MYLVRASYLPTSARFGKRRKFIPLGVGKDVVKRASGGFVNADKGECGWSEE